MNKWEAYKKTYRTEPDIFDFARSGDLRGLADTIANSPNIDLNAPNNRGYSALMLAIYNGQHDFTEALLRCGTDVNTTDAVGNTLLMTAAFKGDLPALQLLLSYGAEVHLKNKSNMNAYDWALMFGRSDIITFFESGNEKLTRTSKIANLYRLIKLSFILIFSKLKSCLAK